MSDSVREDARKLVSSALALYQDDAAAVDVLTALDHRLREPLRLAVAGMVKAGKSTLLNAMIGEQIAPTDAGECTRVVTWYRHAPTPYITMHPHDGEPRRMAVRRDAGRLVLELGGVPADDVDWIDVGWPSQRLASEIIIDTPGIASLSQNTSARSTTFLMPDDAVSSADAVIYLMRHLHGSDLKFLEAFRDTAAGASQTVNAVAVLSRADEIGSGRIDSLLSAARVARRYEMDGDLTSLALGVIPVAGLLAEGARTLREAEFASLRQLALLEREERQRLLISADRFVRFPATATMTLSESIRTGLLARFGIFGVRLATSLIRAGVNDSSQLAERMVEQSGLLELQEFVRVQFRARSAALKVRAVLHDLEQILRSKPRPNTGDIRKGIERIQATSHSLRELSLLSRTRATGFPLPADIAREAERIVGGKGTSPSSRLGLSESASADELNQRLEEELTRWRSLVQSSLTERATVDVGRVVIRSLEEVASHIRPGVAAGAAPDVVLAGGPVEGLRSNAAQQPQQDESALADEQLA